jgi:hypothetical protein
MPSDELSALNFAFNLYNYFGMCRREQLAALDRLKPAFGGLNLREGKPGREEGMYYARKLHMRKMQDQAI